ncbi:type IV pilus modification protein PilV [Solimicrobium silvestre]|uniref:Type IV pilus modification protein PilV n=1 Tax=Solimicrobium silvestre TaxID=2099400 RepID=A0A2S9H4Z1_9BURK|nr:type IV pilus modification protein PilV [Solimicrobium silvestre]PRC95049.1 Type IV pilus modification protein PilV [Solimicrobium silvestre]
MNPATFHRHLNTLSAPSDTGFTIIEILISVLVLTIGILGAIKLQLSSMQTTQQSNFNSVAVKLASEMADKMRGNHVQMQQSDNAFLKVDFNSSDGAPATASMCYGKTECSPDQLAAADISEWLNQLNNALPGARALICRDSSPWSSGANSLTWNCAAGSGNNVSIVIKLGWAEKNGASTSAATNLPPRLAIAVNP